MTLKSRYTYYVITVVFFLACCLAVVIQPNRFQKWNSIKSIDLFNGSRSLSSSNNLGVDSFVGNIPYKKGGGYVYSVSPKEKYEKTILNGNGDCSTLSFGAAYYLLKKNIQFELIHFLPVDSLFSGGGHVASRIPYHYDGFSGIGIVDLAGGGLPSDGEKFLDIFDLDKKNKNISLHRINYRASDFYSNYYKNDYLEKVFFGFTPWNELDRYFEFLNNVYFSFGNDKLEKFFFDGLSMLSGQYYSIYVDNEFLNKFTLEINFFKFLLYSIRITIVLMSIIILFEVNRLFAKIK